MNPTADVRLVNEVGNAVSLVTERPEEALHATWRFIEKWVLPGGLRVAGAVAIIVIGNYAARYLAQLTRYAAERMRIDLTLCSVLASLVRYWILLFTFIAALGRFGIDTNAFVAVLGAAGLAIGLSLQGTMANVAAGALLLFLRPFSIGDSVRVAAGIEGTIKRIDLFTSELMTPDGVHLSLPNASIWGAMISNFSHATVRTASALFYVANGADLRRAIEVLQGVADAEEGFLRDKGAVTADIEKNTAEHVVLAIRGPVARENFVAVSAQLRRNGLFALQAADIAPPPVRA